MPCERGFWMSAGCSAPDQGGSTRECCDHTLRYVREHRHIQKSTSQLQVAALTSHSLLSLKSCAFSGVTALGASEGSALLDCTSRRLLGNTSSVLIAAG